MTAAEDARVLAVVDELVGLEQGAERERALREMQREAQEAATLRRLVAEQAHELKTALSVLQYLAGHDRHVAGLLAQLTDRAENYVLDDCLPDVWPTGSLADEAGSVANATPEAAARRSPGTPIFGPVPARDTAEAREAQEEYVRQLRLGGADEKTLKRLVRPLPPRRDEADRRAEDS